MSFTINPSAVALLRMVLRAERRGGTVPSKGFVLEIAELHEYGLIDRAGPNLVITEKGRQELLRRHPE